MDTKTLDELLAWQFTIAWAGEALCQPPRLKWWRTDLVDEEGGGHLLALLAPRTYRWANLEAVRRASLIVDRKARDGLADPDAVRTLFFWGFEVDERLSERIRDLKWSQRKPEELLPFPVPVGGNWERETLAAALGPQTKYSTATVGRELPGPVPELGVACRRLVGALLPLGEEYPAPFFRL